MREPTSKFFTLMLTSAFCILVGVSSNYAQPTEAQIRKDLANPKIVSLTFGKPGTREWSTTFKKYIWTRTFTAKLTTEEKGVFVIVGGYVAYDIFGTKFTYWRQFINSNSYEGIPNPSAADVQALINKFGLEKFMGFHYRNRIGDIESIGLSDDPKFEWHTMQSVSFNVDAIYTEKVNDVGAKRRGKRTFRIRLYAEKPKGEWNNVVSSSTQAMKEL